MDTLTPSATGEPAGAPAVAVIGAGLAGLAAARRLVAAGARVTVFEKSRGLGGRASTRRSGALAFDHGAQYATARSAAFRAWLEEARERGLAAPWDAHLVTLAGGRVTERSDDRVRWVGTPRMSMLGRVDLGTLAPTVRTRIAVAGRRDGRWILEDAEGTPAGSFDALVVATPAPQAVPLLAAHPSFAERAGAVDMLPCIAAMLAFDRPLEAGFDGAFVEDAPVAWAALDSRKPGRAVGGPECWVLHATARWSASRCGDEDDVLAGDLAAHFAVALARDLPVPVHAAVHRWMLARPARAVGAGEAFLWDEDLRVGACGDWLGGDRLEGAWSSGDALGARVASGL